MVELVFRPPNAILFVAIGIVLVGVISVLLKKGEMVRKITGLVVVVVVAAALLVFLYRSTTLSVDESGIRTDGVGKVELTWDEITSALHEPNLVQSPYRPTVRTRGAALGDYRSGRFLLSNGDPAQVLMERADQAVIFVTDEMTYLFAPAEITALVDAVNQYRSIQESN